MIWTTACASAVSPNQGTSPFLAAKRQAAEHYWQQIIRRARSLLVDERADDDALRQVVDALRTLKDEALTVGKTPPPLRIRREIASLIARYEKRTDIAMRATFVVHSPAMATNRFRWPITPPRIVSAFGFRTDPFDRSKRAFHDGVDLAASPGTPVYASFDGVIIGAGWRQDGCGLSITIAHPNDFKSEFCHLGEVFVHVGDNVSRESIIGSVGNTGRSTGSHLHWGVRQSGLALDPISLVGKRP
ncbi:MAG: M23 family metallopeptidase [Myxococcota bacterium]|nr:M23 family metallopeptidase [Myxococcota bacterium]